MFEHQERELMEGEAWAGGLVNSPVWSIDIEKQKNQQQMNIELTAKQPVNSSRNRNHAKFWWPVFKFFS